MTRATLAALHGHFFTSLRFNPAALLVFVPVVIYAVVRRSMRRGPLRAPVLRAPPWAILTLFAAMWAWNLTLNPTFR